MVVEPLANASEASASASAPVSTSVDACTSPPPERGGREADVATAGHIPSQGASSSVDAMEIVLTPSDLALIEKILKDESQPSNAHAEDNKPHKLTISNMPAKARKKLAAELRKVAERLENFDNRLGSQSGATTVIDKNGPEIKDMQDGLELLTLRSAWRV